LFIPTIQVILYFRVLENQGLKLAPFPIQNIEHTLKAEETTLISLAQEHWNAETVAGTGDGYGRDICAGQFD
jgi:hypothetical protein